MEASAVTFLYLEVNIHITNCCLIDNLVLRCWGQRRSLFLNLNTTRSVLISAVLAISCKVLVDSLVRIPLFFCFIMRLLYPSLDKWFWSWLILSSYYNLILNLKLSFFCFLVLHADWRKIFLSFICCRHFFPDDWVLIFLSSLWNSWTVSIFI